VKNCRESERSVTKIAALQWLQVDAAAATMPSGVEVRHLQTKRIGDLLR
jgi:hypothetical protein